MLSGRRDTSGAIDTSYDEEVGKFRLGGGVASPGPGKPANSPADRRQAEAWADQTHFGFPDTDLDDGIVEALEIAC